MASSLEYGVGPAHGSSQVLGEHPVIILDEGFVAGRDRLVAVHQGISEDDFLDLGLERSEGLLDPLGVATGGDERGPVATRGLFRGLEPAPASSPVLKALGE